MSNIDLGHTTDMFRSLIEITKSQHRYLIVDSSFDKVYFQCVSFPLY